MGIQSYTKHLLKNYQGLSVKTLEGLENFYLDFNSFIHPVSHIILKKNLSGKSKNDVRKMIIKGCCQKLDNLINTANPSKMVYIAIDGTCPIAKMVQQRLRRYATINSDKTYFDSTEITPGTEFMADLSKELLRFCNRKYKTFKVIFSDSSVPGEGECKIMDHIKKNSDVISAIASLDSDLIMHTLCSQYENLFIFRDEVELDLIKIYGNNHFMSIGKLRDAFREDMQNHLKGPADVKNVINDYILMCFFGGNDFVHHIPSVEIRFGGLDTLLEIYWKYMNKSGNQYLTDGHRINFDAYKNYIGMLVDNEATMMKHIGECMAKKGVRTRFTSDDAKKQYFAELINPVYDPIKYLKRGWQQRYYQKLFHMKNIDSNDINAICTRYLNTIEWNLEYYISGTRNWEQHFPYLHAPTITDIQRCLQGYTPKTFIEDNPKSPFEQLMLVLPPSSRSVIPSAVNSLMDSELVEYYPVECGMDTVFCNATWQSKPIFLPLDITEICTAVQECLKNCTVKERNRNKMGDVIEIN
jgi:5'-3' exonuclease